MVALVFIVLVFTTKGAGDCTPLMVQHLGLAAGVGLLLLPPDHEAVELVAVGGMTQVTLLVSGITPEELLNLAHDTGMLGRSVLSRSWSLVPFSMAPRASSSRAIGI